MANICSGALAIESTNKKKISKIFNKMKEEGQSEFDELIEFLNGSVDCCDCRGTFYMSPKEKIIVKNDFYAVILEFDCKWSFDENIINSIAFANDDLTFEYIAECDDYFVNTDINGKYFTDRYYVYDGVDSYYFAVGEEEKIIEIFKDRFKDIVIDSFDDILEISELLDIVRRLKCNIKVSSLSLERLLSQSKHFFPNKEIKIIANSPFYQNDDYLYFAIFQEK